MKASMCVAILINFGYILNTKSMKSLNCAMIIPRLTYFVEVWCNQLLYYIILYIIILYYIIYYYIILYYIYNWSINTVGKQFNFVY